MRLGPRLLAVIGGVALAAPALALDKTTQSGKPVLLWSTWNCQRHNPQTISGKATNGTVEAKSAVESRCGNASEPVTQLWYTPAATFKGVDEVYVYGGASGTGTKIRVTVK